MLVPGEDDPDVDVARVGLLLAQEVVDPRLDVGAETRLLEFLGGEAVLLLLGSRRLVAIIAFEPEKKYIPKLNFCLKTIIYVTQSQNTFQMQREQFNIT